MSRAAVAKWEAGRGYPNIDSLKAISRYFGVSIDSLLSGDELLTLAQEDAREQEEALRTRVFGILDCSAILCLFLPLFGEAAGSGVRSVSLLMLTGVSPQLLAACWIAILSCVACGVAVVALPASCCAFWESNRARVSLALNIAAVLLFIISRQPYAAALLFVFLMVKVILLMKKP